MALWVQDQPLLGLDNPQVHVASHFFPEEESLQFDELAFLSKHTAASGTASLTVHPIGVPWMGTRCPKSGGVAGRCTQPNRDIARLFRSLATEVKTRGLGKSFQVTLEATHHGPFANIPAMFVEIGSTEEHWGNAAAGELWGDLLTRHFDLVSPEAETESGPESGAETEAEGKEPLVLIVLGGSHYTPQANDFARLGERAFVGHSIASYALQPLLSAPEALPDPTADPGPEGGYRAVIDEVISSTAEAFPDGRLLVLIQLKDAGERAKVAAHLGEAHPGLAVFEDFKAVKALYKQG